MEGFKPANDNERSGETLEKSEVLVQAESVYAELSTYDNQEVDAATYQRIKELQAELHTYMMDSRITWHECVERGLPWDPRLEMHKQAANDNAEPVSQAS